MALARRLVRSETSGLRFSENRRGAAVFRLPAMRHDRLHGKIAGHFAVRFSAHSVGEHIQMQRRVNRVTIFVVFSDAPEVGARAGFNVQKGPQSAEVEVSSHSLTSLRRRKHTLLRDSSVPRLAHLLKFRLANRFSDRNSL